MDSKSARFPRQLDQNGLYHSICTTCFRTIAISSNAQVLADREWFHRCDGGSLQGSFPSEALAEPRLVTLSK
jgi:hypothetical protein